MNTVQLDSSLPVEAVVGRYRKKKIPIAFKQSIWIRDCGRNFECKCRVPWCQNRMTVFDFQAGHNVPESKGGPTTPENLMPICARCNTSMGDRYTITEWSALAPAAVFESLVVVVPPAKSGWCCY